MFKSIMVKQQRLVIGSSVIPARKDLAVHKRAQALSEQLCVSACYDQLPAAKRKRRRKPRTVREVYFESEAPDLFDFGDEGTEEAATTNPAEFKRNLTLRRVQQRRNWHVIHDSLVSSFFASAIQRRNAALARLDSLAAGTAAAAAACTLLRGCTCSVPALCSASTHTKPVLVIYCNGVRTVDVPIYACTKCDVLPLSSCPTSSRP
jgi:hypothetical protein